MRVGPGGKRRHLFMPDVQPADSAVSTQRVSKSVQAIANDPVNALYACGG
jgi:hypothetical protein